MVTVPLTSDDDPRFLSLIRRITAGSVHDWHPAEVFVVRIDHWFDHKWCAFAGKLYGAVSFHKPKRLTIPPFHPDRVVSQDTFTLDFKHTRFRKRRAPWLHPSQHSGDNLSRFIGKLSGAGVFVWFSGDTAHSEHGSVMVYCIQGETQLGWYASFRRGKEWQLYKVQGLSRAELTSIMERLVDEPVLQP